MSDKQPEEEELQLDDPLGVGVDSTTLYVIIGVCVCILLLISIGLIFVLKSGSSSTDGVRGTDGRGTDGYGNSSIPSHYTIELKYGDNVNPYNNFSLPPVIPKPPQYFG